MTADEQRWTETDIFPKNYVFSNLTCSQKTIKWIKALDTRRGLDKFNSTQRWKKLNREYVNQTSFKDVAKGTVSCAGSIIEGQKVEKSGALQKKLI